MLAAAKAIVVIGLGAALRSPALFRDDVLVAMAFFAVALLVRRRRVVRAFYGVLCAWAAINVPVALATSSTLTVPMLRAARGPLLDSILHFATARNLAVLAVLTALAVAVPRALRSMRFRSVAGIGIVISSVVLAASVVMADGSDVFGLRRNAVTTMLAGVLDRVPAADGTSRDWRTSPFGAATTEDVTQLRGLAAGRNVVLVVLESTAVAALRMYGAADDPTPNLTALARDAIVFQNAYAVYPESIKALYAVLCGRFPALDVPAEDHARATCAPLSAILGRAGYQTALFHSGRFAYLGMQELVDRAGFGYAADAGTIGGNVQSSFGVDEDAAVDKIVDWIGRVPAGERFFLTYLPAAGHHPYLSSRPGPFDTDSESGAYRNALHDGDRALGTLLEYLRARGLLAQTLFVIIGDHGEAFGEHPGNIGHSMFIYDENLRVPFVIAAPGSGILPGRIARVVSIVDTPSTILDLLGLPAEPSHDGRSVLDPTERMALFFTDYALGWLGLRDGCWKFLHAIEPNRSLLFDVCRDPGERIDRAAAQRARVERYRRHVLGWGSGLALQHR